MANNNDVMMGGMEGEAVPAPVLGEVVLGDDAPAPPPLFPGLAASCTGWRCLCPNFDDTGICWTYSSDTNVALLERALKERKEGNDALYELLKSRHTECERNIELSHKLSKMEADFRAYKNPFRGDFSGLDFNDTNKRILCSAFQVIKAQQNGWELARIALEPEMRMISLDAQPSARALRDVVRAAAVPPAMGGAGDIGVASPPNGEPHLSVDAVLDHMYEISTTGWEAYVKAHR